MVDSIAKVRSRESMEAQFDELDRRLAALDDAAEGEKANKPRRSRRKKNADASVAPLHPIKALKGSPLVRAAKNGES